MNNQYKCKKCSHFVNHDGIDRCTRFHGSLCRYAYKFCEGDLFMDKMKGVSLYALRDWLNRLNDEEMQLPLLFEQDGDLLVPLLVMRVIKGSDDNWIFYSRLMREEED